MDDKIEAAAKAAHEVNKAYCEGCGDFSQPAWEDAPQWQRDSAVSGVRAIAENPETTAEQSHEGWLAHKEADGWVFGELKDPEKKEHPCMVPYAQLPAAQRAKDTLFGVTVRGVLGL